MTTWLSILALLATFYQAYLQRKHNAKSLKPLGQIVLEDRRQMIWVRLYNYGLGPLIVNQITFHRGDLSYESLKECLDLEPRTYTHASMDDVAERVILPNASLTIFEKEIGAEAEAEQIKHQLASLTLEIAGRDIYDHQILLSRSFKWFGRYKAQQKSLSTA